MKIRAETYSRIALLFPYAFGILLFLSGKVADPGIALNSGFPPFDFLYGIFAVSSSLVSVVYFAGAIYWLLPYSFLSIILLLWSRRKNKQQIFKAFRWSPFFLALLILFFSAAVATFGIWPDMFSVEDFWVTNICAFPMSLFFGYIFVSFAIWIHDLLKSWNIILDDDENSNLTIEK